MKHSYSREVVVPVIAGVVHPVVTIVLCVLYWYCIKPYFQNRNNARTQQNVDNQSIGTSQTHRQSNGTTQTYGQSNGTTQTHRQSNGTTQTHRQSNGTTQTHEQSNGTTKTHRQSNGTTKTQGQSNGTTQTHGQSTGTTQTQGQSNGTTQTHRQSNGTTQTHRQSNGTTQTHGQSNGTTHTHGQSNGTIQIHGQSNGTTQIHGQSNDTTQTHGQSIGTTQIHGQSNGTTQTQGQSIGTTQTHGQSNGTTQTHGQSNGTTQTHGQSNDYEKLPRYWKHRGASDTVIKVDITDTAAAECIKTLVHELWSPKDVGKGRDATPGGPASLIITNIYRIENAKIFLKYGDKRQKMVKKKKKINVDHFPSLKNRTSTEISTTEMIRENLAFMNSPLKIIIPGINEHFLFHGTKLENVDSICKNGFMTKFTSRAAFGKGIYLAENPTKNDQYTGDPDGDKYMFLCRACLGEMYVLKKKPSTDYDTPPCRECRQPNCTTHKYTFDSAVVHNPEKLRFREFIVFRDYRTYPEYLIQYKLFHEVSEA